MRLDKLATRLRREALASPKKAAALGLLLLVAVWFWVPLAWGWLRSEEASTETTTATTTPPPKADEPVVAATSDERNRQTGTRGWKDIAKRIESDPRMTVATELPGRPNPFDRVRPPVSDVAGTPQEQKERGAAAAILASRLDPESLGLALSSTIVGSQGGTALINGKSYRVGETIRVDHEGHPVEFQLTTIHADSVVLRRGEKDYQVRLPEPAGSEQIQINILNED